MLLGAANAMARLTWLADAVLAVSLLYLTYDAVTTRSLRSDDEDKYFKEFTERLKGRPSADDLVLTVTPMLVRDPAVGGLLGEERDVRFITSLGQLSEEEANTVSALCEATVNHINRACELVDENLVLVGDLARQEHGLHRSLLIETRLVAPFVWLTWLYGGRGRWGLRLIQLGDALDDARAGSWDESLWDAVAVEGQGADGAVSLVVARPLAGWRRSWQRAANVVRPPTINRRTKIEMLRRRDRLARRLGRVAPERRRQW